MPMNALVVDRIAEARVVQRALPANPGPLDAIIRTTVATITPADVAIVRGDHGSRTGRIIGHAACGIVEKVGSEVKAFAPGDRVVVNSLTACYTCSNCLRGMPSQCSRILGGWKFGDLKDGCLAEYFHVNYADANLCHIPFGITDDCAVFSTEIMPLGFLSVENAHIPLGGSVIVLGLNSSGLMAVVAARLLGAAQVLAVDRSALRRELAREMGADISIDPDVTDPVRKALQLTRQNGMDAAIVCADDPALLAWGVNATGPGGAISCTGTFRSLAAGMATLPASALGERVFHSASLTGGNERIRRMLRLIENARVNPRRLTTHCFTFENVEQAMALMMQASEDVVHLIVTFPNKSKDQRPQGGQS